MTPADYSGRPPGWRRLFTLPFIGRAIERDVDDELAFHVAMREDALRRRGLTSDAAHAQAVARFGDADRVRDECITIDRQYAREVRTMEWLRSLRQDVRYALRTLRRAPVFASVAILTLALGIGATTAVFSLVENVLLSALPYPRPDRLVRVIQSYPEKGLDNWTLSQANAATYRARARSFSAFTAYSQRPVTLTGIDVPAQLTAMYVTGDFFKVFGVRPMLGREFLPQEDTPNRNQVAILGYALWQTRFGGDPGIVGRTVRLNLSPYVVVGIMPASFSVAGAQPSDLYIPLGIDPRGYWGWFLRGVARLAPGVTPDAARRETTGILWSATRENPNFVGRNDVPPADTHLATKVELLRDAAVGSAERPLLVLQGAVLLILLIACANVATLLLARGARRAREMALRSALGASKARIARQLITESLVLGLGGAVLGVAIAVGAVRVLPHLPVSNLPRLSEVRVSSPVLAVALLTSLGAAFLFGLAPVLHARRLRLTSDLNEGARWSSSRGRTHAALVMAQLALSIVLLVNAGLVLQSVRHLLGVDYGFDPHNVTNISIPLPKLRYPQARIAPFTEVLLERVRALPGVVSASVSWGLPFWSSGFNGYEVEGHAYTAEAGAEPQTVTNAVSSGYFANLRIPLLRGRDFGDVDRADGRQVVIVDKALARRFWPNDDAVGRRIRMTGDTTWSTIVGLVGSVRDNSPGDEPMPHTYFPYSQMPGQFVNMAVRTRDGSPAALRPVLAAVRSLDPELPLDTVQPLPDVIRSSIDDRRLMEMLLGGFAALALVLSAIGIYGVMSLFVSNRNREFGVRLAVGAAPGELLRLVLRESFLIAAGGVIAGVVLALVLSRAVASLLYQVSPTDPAVFGTLALGLLAVAIAASWLPARRAARSDPLIALRAD